jgi:uncharacterized membrane protein
MTQNMTGGPTQHGPNPAAPQTTTESVRQEAGGVAHTAKESGGQVADTAIEQARQVTGEARDQARDLLQEGRQQVREQAQVGQRKAADSLSGMADELGRMADNSDGMVGDLARQGASRAREFSEWLQRREPGELLDEVRGWARQRPGTFLLGAALAGVLAGRLTSGTMAARRDTATNGDSATPASTGTAPATTPMTTPPTPTPAAELYGDTPATASGIRPGGTARPTSPYLDPDDAGRLSPSEVRR